VAIFSSKRQKPTPLNTARRLRWFTFTYGRRITFYWPSVAHCTL